MLKKIALTGPESTGKSTLCQQLAAHYPNSTFVSEYARTYIDQLDRPYDYQDILTIAQRQWQIDQAKRQQNHQLLFADTELLVTKIWCDYVYGTCHDWILEHLERQDYDLYLLMDVDIQWVMDSQREYPTIAVRKKIFELFYQKELTQRGFNFIIIRGTYPQRFEAACRAIDSLF